jgi:6-pyruvoyltetrahydropterin/6-carboxytetrahydropterin synthase
MGKFYSTKRYGNEEGLSCVFRQWRSTHSHCSTLHGYAIGIKLIFECDTLDERNWVMDFGGLKDFKAWCKHMFDHTVIVAEDDPMLEQFKQMAALSRLDDNGERPCDRGAIMDLRILPSVGCEKFAELAYMKMDSMLKQAVEDGTSLNPSVRVKSVEVFEHGANSAIYEG